MVVSKVSSTNLGHPIVPSNIAAPFLGAGNLGREDDYAATMATTPQTCIDM